MISNITVNKFVSQMRRAIPLSLCFILFALLSTGVNTQAISDQDNEIVRSIIRSAQGPSAVDQALRQLGFPPPDTAFTQETWSGYRGWPDRRKLEAAFSAANAAETGSGQHVLKSAMMLIAKKNAAIVEDQIFKEQILSDNRYVKESGRLNPKDIQAYKSPRFKFEALPRVQHINPLPQQMAAIVKTIVKHSPRIAAGLPAAVLNCCGISSDAVYRQMKVANTYEEILTWALRTGNDPPDLDERLEKLVQNAKRNNAALAYHETMRRFTEESQRGGLSTSSPAASLSDDFVIRAQGSSTVETQNTLERIITEASDGNPPASISKLIHPLSNIAHGVSSRDKSNARLVARQFTSFQAGNYRVLPDTSRADFRFSVARRKARGFGGVVFGNKVSSGSSIPTPLWFEWQPITDTEESVANEAASQWGFIVIYFTDGSTGVTRLIRTEHMWAAITITYNGIEGVRGPIAITKDGDSEPVGLAGYTGSTDFHYLDEGLVKQIEGAARTFVVHPAIAGYKLGQDALLVDAVPFNFPNELQRAVEHNIKVGLWDNGENSLHMFNTWLYDDNRSTYKFIDVPLVIKREPLGIVRAVRVVEKENKWTESLYQHAFLSFQKFDTSGEPTDEEIPPFYPLVPLLVDSWPSFARLNDFAEAFAIVRWLRLNSADFPHEMSMPSREAALTTMLFIEGESPKLMRPVFELNIQLAEEVRDLGAGLLENSSGSLRFLNDQIHQLRIERLIARQALELWDISVIEQSGLVEEWSETNQEAMLLEYLLNQSDSSFRETLASIDSDFNNISIEVLKREFTEDYFEVKKTADELKQNIDKLPESIFLSNVGRIEEQLANKNPLSRTKASILLDIGAIPDTMLNKYERLQGEYSWESAKRERLAETINRLTSERETSEGISKELLVSTIGTEDERKLVNAIDDEIKTLNAKIEDNNTSALWRWAAKWEKYRANNKLDSLLSNLRGSRAESKISDLREEMDKLEISIRKLEMDAEIELGRGVKELNLPEFDRWWALQQSFRNQVFTP